MYAPGVTPKRQIYLCRDAISASAGASFDHRSVAKPDDNADCGPVKVFRPAAITRNSDMERMPIKSNRDAP